MKLNSVEKGEESSGTPLDPSVIYAGIVSVCLYVFWSQFHEMNRWYGASLTLPDIAFIGDAAIGGFLNCALRPLGIIVGCLIIFVAKRRNDTLSNRSAQLTLIPLLVISLILTAFISQTGSWLFALSCEFFVSVLVTYAVAFLFLSLASLGKRPLLIITALALVVSKFYSLVIMMLAVNFLGLLGAALASALPLICAFVFWKKAQLQPFEPHEIHEDLIPAQAKSHARRPLVAHLLFYGFGLGLFHAMLGIGFNLGGDFRTLVEFVGVCLAAIVAVIYLRKLSLEEDLWQNIRGVVFPSAIIGFLLIPASSVYTVSAVLESFSLSYYAILFAMGCYLMMKNTVLKPLTIAIMGLLFKSIGSFAGIILGTWLSLHHISGNIQAIAITTAVVFAAFTLGTFWLGKDSDLRKWWGLRRNYTAQQFRDQQLERKSKLLADEHNLSNREEEILVKLAQGKRAQQICDECYISIYTVRNHTQKIYRKLGVHSFSELDALIADIKLDM